jgi:hypothetical protein
MWSAGKPLDMLGALSLFAVSLSNRRNGGDPTSIQSDV